MARAIPLMTEEDVMPETRAPGTYVEEIPFRSASITAAPTSTVAFLGEAERGPLGMPVTVRSMSELTATFGTARGPLAAAVDLFFLNGGKDAVVVRLSRKEPVPAARDVAGRVPIGGGKLPVRSELSIAPSSAPMTRLDVSCFTAVKGGARPLDGAAFSLMCIPPFQENRGLDIEVLAAAAAYCRERRAMLIIDAPPEWSDAGAAERGVSSIRAALGAAAGNAMVYFPQLRQGSGPSARELPPGGAVAGVIARMDAQRGAWRSPAGMEAQLRGVEGPAITVSGADLDRLGSAAVNCIRTVPGIGPVVWGARTLEGHAGGNLEWRYIAVRRLALLIEESLIRGLAWTAFEPNGEVLWALVRQSAGSFLDDLHRRGAFQGTSPRDAFFAKCDRETTAQADIELGVANLIVGFAPLRPAEFIILRIQLRAVPRP